MNQGGYCVHARIESIATETTGYTVFTLPDQMRLVAASVYIDNVNCTGTGAAAKVNILTGSGGGTTMLTGAITIHVTNDNQELTPSIKQGSGANVDATTKRVRVQVTAAGGDTSVVAGIQCFLFFERPLLP